MKRFYGWLSLCALLCIAGVAQAQNDCSVLIYQALVNTDANCQGLSYNSVCYGSNGASAQFTDAGLAELFVKPSDKVGVGQLNVIQTQPIDAVQQVWGIALMNLQASLPRTLQPVKFLLLGDTQVENAVNATDAFVPVAPIEVIPNVGANIRNGASTSFRAIGSVAKGAPLYADATNTAKDWVRVVYDNQVGWITRSALNTNPVIDTLPILTDDQRTVMQAFYLRTDTPLSTCINNPRSTLLIQTPKNLDVVLTINGANIRIGSTVLIYTPQPELMELTVLDGQAEIIGGNPDGTDLVVKKGYSSNVCMTAPQNLGADGIGNDHVVSCVWSEATAVAPSDFAYWCYLQGLPNTLLNYPLQLPCNNNVAQNPVSTPVPNTTPGALQATPVATVANVYCGNFRVLSPNNGTVSFEETTYSWTTVAIADQYAVNFMDASGNFIKGEFSAGTQNTLTYFNGDLPTSNFTWVVYALKNGQVICSASPSALLARAPNPDAPERPEASSGTGGGAIVPVGPFSISQNCDKGTIIITWDNLTSFGDTLSFSGGFSGNYNSDFGYVNTNLFSYSGVSWQINGTSMSGNLDPLTC